MNELGNRTFENGDINISTHPAQSLPSAKTETYIDTNDLARRFENTYLQARGKSSNISHSDLDDMMSCHEETSFAAVAGVTSRTLASLCDSVDEGYRTNEGALPDKGTSLRGVLYKKRYTPAYF